MEHKKFMDIQRIKPDIVSGFEVGDKIVIQEKIDGANAAVRYDAETDSVVAQSRKHILSATNNLRGFYEWSQTLDKNKVKECLGDNLIVYCEWLVPHTVKYPTDKYNRAYAFDVYDTNTQQYLTQDKVAKIARELGVACVPTFYCGEFVSWEHCMGFVDTTELGGEYGEGIIAKNQTKLNDPNTRNPFYIKIVGDKFAEVHSSSKKPISAEVLKAREEEQAIVGTVVTEARVRKILHKLVDEGILPESWGADEMPIVAKNLPRAVHEDCLKEEPDVVAKVSNFGKVANSIAMKIARDMI